MMKILLVEKRYDKNEEKPLVTAQWIEIPDGEEEIFLKKQLTVVNEKLLPKRQNVKSIETENKNIATLKVEDELAIQQEALAQKKINTNSQFVFSWYCYCCSNFSFCRS